MLRVMRGFLKLVLSFARGGLTSRVPTRYLKSRMEYVLDPNIFDSLLESEYDGSLIEVTNWSQTKVLTPKMFGIVLKLAIKYMNVNHGLSTAFVNISKLHELWFTVERKLVTAAETILEAQPFDGTEMKPSLPFCVPSGKFLSTDMFWYLLELVLATVKIGLDHINVNPKYSVDTFMATRDVIESCVLAEIQKWIA